MVELHRNVITCDVVCSCKGGKNHMPCKHAARVLLREGLFRTMKPEPVEAISWKAA